MEKENVWRVGGIKQANEQGRKEHMEEERKKDK